MGMAPQLNVKKNDIPRKSDGIALRNRLIPKDPRCFRFSPGLGQHWSAAWGLSPSALRKSENSRMGPLGPRLSSFGLCLKHEWKVECGLKRMVHCTAAGR
jgi:hypothetical protein